MLDGGSFSREPALKAGTNDTSDEIQVIVRQEATCTQHIKQKPGEKSPGAYTIITLFC